MAPVIDVHTHMLGHAYLELLERHGAPRLTLKEVVGGLRAIHLDDAPFMTPVPQMFDYDARIRMMDEVGIDVSIVSLTCPNVYFGSADVSLQAARVMNDDMAAARKRYGGRIEYFCSLPWQHAELATAELARARSDGARGVMVLANIAGRPLTAPEFAPVWQAIDAAALPVLVHPTAPPGVREMQMNEFQLTASIGFTFDTTLAISRMLFDGFFDRFTRLKIIAGHGGGALPFLIGRLDQCFRNIPACRTKTQTAPGSYMGRLYADSVVFTQQALELALHVFGDDCVMYGSDYPHTIGDPPGCLARVNALAGARRDKVRGGTAQRLFGL